MRLIEYLNEVPSFNTKEILEVCQILKESYNDRKDLKREEWESIFKTFKTEETIEETVVGLFKQFDEFDDNTFALKNTKYKNQLFTILPEDYEDFDYDSARKEAIELYKKGVRITSKGDITRI